jgi:uncharacterized cupin superfamily protein
MTILQRDSLRSFTLPGLQHRTLASTAQGLSALEVWWQTLAPGGSTPPHYHECEEVVVIQRGSGQAVSNGQSRSFGPGVALIFTPREVHQIVNSGAEDMVLLAALSECPARVFSPSGEEIILPWQGAAA